MSKAYKVGDKYLVDGIPHIVRYVNAGMAWLAPASGESRHIATTQLNDKRICEATGRKAAKVTGHE